MTFQYIYHLNFNQEYLNQFKAEASLSKKDMLEFYMGEGIRERYNIIDKNINEI